MQNRFVKMGEAAELLGTTRETLRRWEETGEWLPARKTHAACGVDYLSQPQQEQDVQDYSRISKRRQDFQEKRA